LSGAPKGPDKHEAEFAEQLRLAAYVFETEKNGRFKGSILACLAVVEFIRRRGGGAELAGPFVAIAAAFRDLEKGGNPGLFSKKSAREKERDRSPERKRIHELAAAALAVLVKRGVERVIAAEKIARHVNKWPGMRAQEISGSTVINWRNQQRHLSESERNQFELLVEKMLEEPDPEQTVESLLRNGPPGLWTS
jgi:hypothetical protein